jgi:hypothetical protein
MTTLTKNKSLFLYIFVMNICGKNTYIIDFQLYIFYVEDNVEKKF